MALRFYVYELFDESGVRYVGKGSSNRLRSQRSKFKLDGREIARFKREKDAYEFEIKAIAEKRPPLNKHPGGKGSYATPKREPRVWKGWTPEALRKSRIWCAKFLLERGLFSSTEQLTQLRLAANGYLF